MKQISILKKSVSVLLALCVLICLFSFPSAVPMAKSGLSPEEEKANLEQQIKEANNKLEELKEQSAGTSEYMKTLSSKIYYLEQQADLVADDVKSYKSRVDSLQSQCEENEKAILETQAEIDELNVKLAEYNDKFDSNFDAYCKRLRAMYISGETDIFTFLLTSNDISQFLTRYEMLRRIAKKDSDLLKSIEDELSEMEKTVDELAVKDEMLTERRTQLLMSKEELEASLTELNEKQSDLEAKKTNLSAERASANLLLKKLSDETGRHTEFLEESKKELEELDKEIEEAAKKYAESLSTTSATTKKPQTTQGGENNDGDNEQSPENTSSQSGNSSRYISLTYPVPSQKRVTCGIHGYAGHSGADFACPTGSRVVAAESGVVIVSTDLTNPDGSYRSYGRYIIIMHDKTTPSGDPVFTLYAHNSTRVAYEGQHVEKGQLIAYSGSTGNSTGPHCHFEVRTPSSKYSDCKDPEKYLP